TSYNLQVKIKYKICQRITEYSNKLPNAQFSSLTASAGLVGGVNRQQLQTIFSIIGIIAQSSKVHYHSKQNEYLEKINKEAEINAQIALSKAIVHIKAKGERVLSTSFNCSWSYCQNANQARYNHKPVIAFATSEKPQATDVLLDIGVNRDLNSNKTLNNILCMSKVYADLKHVGKNIRAKIDYENTIMTYYNSCVYAASGRKLDENKIIVLDAELENVQIDGFVAHLSDDHSLCWNKVCWRKDNPNIQLKALHLKEYTPNQREKTSYNKAFNRVKLCFQDKKIDYWKTYTDEQNISKIAEERKRQNQRNSNNIAKRNEERGKKIQEQKTSIETFDWDKVSIK
ncbi:hypothetical protein RhiirA1_480080, partial [Rhizophagus irregularis]